MTSRPEMTTTEPTALADRLNSFIDALRTRGLPVSLSERIDAMRAVETVSLTSGGLYTALSATLVKNGEHLTTFDEIFGLYFRTPASTPGSPSDDESSDEPPLDDLVRSVLTDGSAVLARLLAEQAVARFAGFERGRATAGLWYERNAAKGIRLDELAAEAPGPADAVAQRSQLIREQIRAVILEQLIGDRGVDAVAKTVGTPLLSDLVIARADPEQLREIRRALKVLQRKLATTLMRKRRHRRGPLDVGRTLHASMSTGGVPMRVIHRRPNPTKPDLYVLADMSGSVAPFAAFTVSLVSGMSEQFSRFRCFAFIENTVEVTDIFRELDDPGDALRAVNRLESLNAARARTDYGHSLRQFAELIRPQLGRRSSVLIFGDGRGNYRPGGEQYLAEIAQRAGSVHWLNPEPRNLWGGGDSRMSSYEKLCTDAMPCRTLGDLRAFVETLD